MIYSLFFYILCIIVSVKLISYGIYKIKEHRKGFLSLFCVSITLLFTSLWGLLIRFFSVT